MELTDLEIETRIAEIEGVDFVYNGENGKLWINKNGVYSGNQYNPLTDDALCFALMVKYKVDVQWESVTLAKIYDDPESDPTGMAYDENPNKAILLCIIEAHKES